MRDGRVATTPTFVPRNTKNHLRQEAVKPQPGWINHQNVTRLKNQARSCDNIPFGYSKQTDKKMAESNLRPSAMRKGPTPLLDNLNQMFGGGKHTKNSPVPEPEMDISLEPDYDGSESNNLIVRPPPVNRTAPNSPQKQFDRKRTFTDPKPYQTLPPSMSESHMTKYVDGQGEPPPGPAPQDGSNFKDIRSKLANLFNGGQPTEDTMPKDPSGSLQNLSAVPSKQNTLKSRSIPKPPAIQPKPTLKQLPDTVHNSHELSISDSIKNLNDFSSNLDLRSRANSHNGKEVPVIKVHDDVIVSKHC